MGNAKQKSRTKPGSEETSTGEGKNASAKRTRAVSVEQLVAVSDEFRAMVAQAAYYRAEARGFEPGHEESDWLEAEDEIRTIFGGA